MSFFPAEHRELDISPYKPEQIIARMQELAAQHKFAGTIFHTMFTLHYTPPYRLPSGRQLKWEPMVTGYFSQDPRKLLLDYSFSKKGKVFSIIQMFAVPLFPLLIFAIAAHRRSLPAYVFALFYLLWVLFDGVVSYLVFRVSLAKIHRMIALQASY